MQVLGVLPYVVNGSAALIQVEQNLSSITSVFLAAKARALIKFSTPLTVIGSLLADRTHPLLAPGTQSHFGPALAALV